MTATRPTSRSTGPEPDDSTSGRRGFAAVVPLRRMFAPENRDAVLLTATTVFLVAFGLVMVLSASSVEEQSSSGDPFGRVARQAVFAAIGIPLMLVASRMPTRFWKRWSWPALLIGAVLQIMVFIPGLSYDYGGNQNWLSIGGFTMQPSEFVKLALVVWVAWVLAAKRDLLGNWKHALIPVVPIAGGAIVLVLIGRDLGTATIMMLIVFACAYFGGVRIHHLVVFGMMVATAAVQNLLGGDEMMKRSRKPEVYADAAYAVLSRPAGDFTGNTLLCEDVLLDSGVTGLSVYDCVPGFELGVDFWVDSPNPPGYRQP